MHLKSVRDCATHRSRGRKGGENEKVTKTIHKPTEVPTAHFTDLDQSPKSSPLMCEYLGRRKGSAPADDHRRTVLLFRDRMGLQ